MRNHLYQKKILTSVIFPPAILGPEMASPILWAPGFFWFFLLETPCHKIHTHEIPCLEGGVEVPILFLWAWRLFRY